MAGIRRTSLRSNFYRDKAGGGMLLSKKGGGPAGLSFHLKMSGESSYAIFEDFGPNALSFTAYGTAAASTVASKFDGYSALINTAAGSGGYALCDYNSAFDVSGSDFCYGVWIYPTAHQAGGARIISCGGGAIAFNSTNGIHWFTQLTSTGGIQTQFWNGTGVDSFSSGGATFSLNTWGYLTIARQGTTCYTGVNGTVYSTTKTFARPSTNPVFGIGGINGDGGGGSNCFRGHVTDLHFRKGVADFTASFTPPTRQWPYG